MRKYLFILLLPLVLYACNSSSKTSTTEDNNNSSINNSNNSNRVEEISTTLLLYVVGTDYEKPETAVSFFQDVAFTNALGYGPANYMIKGMIDNVSLSNTKIIIQTASNEEDMTWSDDEITAAGANPNRFYIKDWSKIKRWQITANGLEQIGEDLGDVCSATITNDCIDISSSEAISDFLTFGTSDEYASDRYIVIFVGYGGGSLYGFGAGTSATTMKEAFEIAKEETDVTFDIIGFAAGLMGNLEWAYNLSDYGTYYVAHEEVSYTYPWLLGYITKAIGENYETTEVLETITNNYWNYSALNGNIPTNISVIDLSQMANINTAFSNLANAISGANYSNVSKYNNLYVSIMQAEQYGLATLSSDIAAMFDLKDLSLKLDDTSWYGQNYSSYTRPLRSAIESAILINRTSDYLPNSYGLSIYAPVQTEGFNNTLNTYATATNNATSSYVAMLRTLMEEAYSTSTYIAESVVSSGNELTSISNAGVSFDETNSKFVVAIDTNFAPTYGSSVEMICNDDTTRTTTIIGQASIDVSTETSNIADAKIYLYELNTGTGTTASAYFLALQDANNVSSTSPLRVNLMPLSDNNATMRANTLINVTRNDETLNVYVMVMYQMLDDGFDILSVSYSQIDESYYPINFSFKEGDIVTIPDYNTTSSSELDNTEEFTITCQSDECVNIVIDKFEITGDATYNFLLQNTKGENYTYSFSFDNAAN